MKKIIKEYVKSFIECINCNYMCSPKHFTQSNRNKRLKNNSICNHCIEVIKEWEHGKRFKR